MLVVLLLDPGELESLAVVAEGDPVPRQVIPHRSRLGIVFGNERAIGSHRIAPAGSRALLLERPADRIGHLHQVVGLDAHQPAMPHPRGLRLHVEIVADGELPGEGVVIHHHADVVQCWLPLQPDGLVQPPSQQGGIVVGPRDPVEDGVVGVILLGDEHHVLDLGGGLARHRGNQRRGQGGPVGRAVHQAVVLQDLCCHAAKCVVRRDLQNAQHTAHAEEGALGNLAAGVRTVAKAPEANAGQLFSIRGERDPVGIPGGGNVAEHLEGGRIEDADGVDPEFRDVQPAAIRREHHARSPHAAQSCHQGRRHDPMPRGNAAARRINPLDQVIVAVRDEQLRALLGEKVGGAPTHRFVAIRRGADEQSGFHPADHPRRRRRRHIHAPHGKGFRDVGLAEPGNLAAFKFDTLLCLTARIAERRLGQATIIKLRILGGTDRAVLEQPDVRHLDPVALHHQGIGIPPHSHRANHRHRLGVDDHQPEIGGVGAVKVSAIRGQLHVGGIAVLVLAAVEGAVKRDLRGDCPGRDIQDQHFPVLAAAPVQQPSVGGKIRAARIGVSRALALGLGEHHREDFRSAGLPFSDQLPGAVTGNEERRAIACLDQSVGLRRHGIGLPGGGQVPAV